MKADCVMSSSSAMRTRCRYWSAVSPTLTMMSWPGLLMAYLPWNKKARAEAPAKTLDPEGETVRSSGREKVARISGGLLGLAVGAAQVRPIDIGAQVFAADGAARFALNFDRELFAARLAVTDVFNVPTRRCAAVSKGVTLVYRHREKVSSKFHAPKYTPSGVVRKHHFVNIAKLNRLV